MRAPLRGALRRALLWLGLAGSTAPMAGAGGGSLVPGELLINCGGGTYGATTGEIWSADHGFSSPSLAFSHAFPIAGTSEQALYQDGRQGLSFTYSLSVPASLYDITLHFAEHRTSVAGRRVFDVVCEDQLWLDDLDLVVAAGPRTALQRTLRRTIADGTLDLRFQSVVEAATVCAIEVRSPKLLILNHGTLDYGTVALGNASTKNLVLRNRSLHPITITEIGFENVQGAGHEFSFDLGGWSFQGEHQDVVIPASITIPGLGTLTAPIVYAPTEHVANDVRLRFSGDFEAPAEVRLLGSGGTGDPYLHAVLLVDPYTVDYDETGSEPVVLDGSDSHTHELGHGIVSWTWTKNGQGIGSGPVITPTLPVGSHTVELSVADDNQPPRTTSTSKSFRVVVPEAVPGIVVLYYGASGGDPADLLEDVPANADEAELSSALEVSGERGVGSSSFTSDVMVRMLGKWRVTQPGSYTFTLTGGTESRLLLGGHPIVGPVEVPSGLHTIDARFAVASVADLPLEVRAALDGGTATAIDAEHLIHDQTTLLPVINTMPGSGLAGGGYTISIDGLGFFPRASTQVLWGPTVIPESAFTSWSAERIEFQVPAGEGTRAVRVQNAVGTSDVHAFEYTPSGPVPIAFDALPEVSVSEPTVAEWGPDGRLYVGTLGGEIKAITFDEDYAATNVQTYVGVSELVNKNILGLTFSPWEGTLPVRVYVAHGQLYQNGGGSFEGPSWYTGQVSRLSGPAFSSPEALVTGLPVSNHDHGINGLTFDSNGDLLMCVGANTNAGVQHPWMGDLPESPLSGAIVKARLSDPGFQGAVSYAFSSSGQPSNDQVHGELVDVADGAGHVVVHAAGMRNAYDLLLATSGLLYATDNGPNYGFGAASTGPTTHTDDPESGDELLLIEPGAYYGHPNRNRARYDPRQAVFHFGWEASIPGAHTSQIAGLASSTNGLAEYRAATFNGAMRGQLLVQKWNDFVRRVELTSDGRGVVRIVDLHPLLQALDVVTGPGGAILGIDYTGNRIQPLRPNDSGANGLVVYDITPWRGPDTGGVPFTIGGSGFGSLSDTTVTIGGAQASLTSVSSKRITGLVPANPSAGGALQDIVVSVGGTSRTLTQAWLYLTPPG